MIAPADFAYLQTLLKSRCGLALSADKSYLVASRLAPVARALGYRGVVDLLASVRQVAREDVVAAVVEAMATHETSFFRDAAPFQFLVARLAHLRGARADRKTVSIWSAACSSGQEPYSIAMSILETCGALPDWRFRILATDFSAPILEKAASGRYSAFEVQRGLSDERRMRFFEADGDAWRIAPPLKAMVEFRQHNLLDNPCTLGRFDIIFCRNALIYFDPPTKTRVLSAIADLLPSDGALVLGSAETVLGLATELAPVPGHHSVYQLARALPARAAS